MNNFLKYLSTAPVILIIWLIITSVIIILINNIYPDILNVLTY